MEYSSLLETAVTSGDVHIIKRTISSFVSYSALTPNRSVYNDLCFFNSSRILAICRLSYVGLIEFTMSPKTWGIDDNFASSNANVLPLPLGEFATTIFLYKDNYLSSLSFSMSSS